MSHRRGGKACKGWGRFSRKFSQLYCALLSWRAVPHWRQAVCRRMGTVVSVCTRGLAAPRTNQCSGLAAPTALFIKQCLWCLGHSYVLLLTNEDSMEELGLLWLLGALFVLHVPFRQLGVLKIESSLVWGAVCHRDERATCRETKHSRIKGTQLIITLGSQNKKRESRCSSPGFRTL